MIRHRNCRPAQEFLGAYNGRGLVQLSWILTDERKEVGRADFIIRPDGFTIPEEASDVHGITTERALKEGIGVKEAIYYFLGAARCADCLVGHTHVVGAEFIRIWNKDYILGMKTFDTMKSSVDFCAIEGAYGRYDGVVPETLRPGVRGRTQQYGRHYCYR